MAAAELFYRNGYENTTLEAVGDALGVTKPVIYSHFATKADLLAEICARGISSSLAAMDMALKRENEPRAQLAVLGDLFVRAVLTNQMHIAIFAREEKNLGEADFRRISDLRRDFDRKLRDILRRGVDTGVFVIADCDLTALAIGGMVSWAYEWYRPNGRLGDDQIGREFSRLILNMVCRTDPA
jgi:AcrR family transcriptional regulator